MTEDPFHTSREWLDLRYRVLKQHNGCCQLCGSRGGSDNPIQVDHIKPRSKFPALALVVTNLQVLCKNCNLGKGAKDDTDWRWTPSRELTILETADPASRAKLQQLGWLRLYADSQQMKSEANREYNKLWREVQVAWFERGRPS